MIDTLTRQSIFNEELFEIPETKVGDFWFEGLSRNKDVADLKVAVKYRVPKVVEVRYPLGDACVRGQTLNDNFTALPCRRDIIKL